MQVLRLLAPRRRPRRAVSTITTAAAARPAHSDSEPEEEEGPFFDLDFSSSVRASSTSSSGSDESDDACSELDFIISLHRSRSASPSYETLLFGGHPTPLQFCASEPPSSTAAAGLLLPSSRYGGQQKKRGGGAGAGSLRTLSFGAKKAAFYGGRPSFASSGRSLRLFMESPADDDEDVSAASVKRRAPSGEVIRRYLTKISRRLRSVRPRAATAAGDSRGLQRLRKSRSASAAVSLAPSRRDDSLVEKQDGIASAIAHCKESFRRASMSELDSSLLRSRSDPGKCEAA